ncbi:MAG TPA: 30s ribosomal protein S12 methylthiotransferase accessory protein YcaO [bacterium]|nr:30s ribosomal protein S12 methylthiotransferase accessory protein YcaO [bacterium]
MTEQTFITGKDAALEVSIERMFARLAELGFEIEEARWLNPVPHVWSVHIRDKHAPFLFTNGKGASRKAALASALGEYFERLATQYFFSDYDFGDELTQANWVHHPRERWFPVGKGKSIDKAVSAGLMDAAMLEAWNPHGDLTAAQLLDRNAGFSGRGICALPFVRQRDGEETFVPVNILANLFASNGMAAGNTPFEARTQCLAEIFERHVRHRVISEGWCLPDVPTEILARYPHVLRAIEAIEASGFPILVKDASLGGRYPVLSVILLNPHNGGVYASWGAHPRFEVALERTLTELLQGRDLNQLGDFHAPSFDLDEVADPANMETHFIDHSGLIAWDFFHATPDIEFTEWDYSGSTEEEFQQLVGLIHAEDKDAYILDLPHLGVYACRIVVPGFSEVYPAEDMQENNSNAALPLRESLRRLPELDENERKTLLRALNKAGFADEQPVAELLGLLADPGTAWASLRVGELRGWLHLSLGKLNKARDDLGWALDFGGLSPARARLLRAVNDLLRFMAEDGFEVDDFRPVLTRLHGIELFARAERLIGREELLPDLFALHGNDGGMQKHALLLQAYARLRAAHEER